MQSKSQLISEYLESYKQFNYFLEKYPPSNVGDKRSCEWRTATPTDKRSLNRAMTDKLLIVDEKIIFEHQREFVILTDKGNVYTVTIGRLHNCPCFMFSNRSCLCKHIMFILRKVLNVQITSPLLFQFGLTVKELYKLFENRKSIPKELMAKQSIINKFKQIRTDNAYVKRQPIAGNHCTICAKSFARSTQSITWCRKKCGVNVHVECLRALDDSKHCYSCNALWINANDFEYLNLFQ